MIFQSHPLKTNLAIHPRRNSQRRLIWTLMLLISFGSSTSAVFGQSTFDDPAIGLQVDLELVKAVGIRKLAGKHLTLFTDLPALESVEELPRVFDAAVTQWQAYFRHKDAAAPPFQAVGFLMKDINKFRRAKLIPRGLPDFANGYTFGRRTFWMYDQPSDYMRRQLMLHEGTHAFLFTSFSPSIAPWLNEGLAEYFGAHQWQDNKLQTGFLVPDRDNAPFWGRPKSIRDQVKISGIPSVEAILEFKNDMFAKVEPYPWVWALTLFFNTHPKYRDAFLDVARTIRPKTDSTRELKTSLASQWEELEIEWETFVRDLDYGVSAQQTAIQWTPIERQNRNLPKIDVTQSWQNSGFPVTAGKTYRIRAKGRYTIRKSVQSDLGSPQPREVAWPCEPNGLSLEYHRGNPLGCLMATVLGKGDKQNDSDHAMNQSIRIGLDRTWRATGSGDLFFRVNESPAGYLDNSGSLLVAIEEVASD